MQLVVDANIVFAALIKAGHTRHFLVSSGWDFYFPEFLLTEVNKYIETLSAKTGLTNTQIRELLAEFIIGANIQVIPNEDFKGYMPLAREVCPTPEDVHYFALALKLNCGIWTNEKKLKDQDKVKIYTTTELLRGIF